ncbi:MAG: carbohydrate kinase family protein [Candidatus Methanomethylicaceae archaeon]
MLEIISIGNINIDLSFFIDKLPDLDGEESGELEIFHGGSAANFAVGASRLGIKTGILGCVGDDGFGREALEELRKEGVVTKFVRVLKGRRTGMVCVLVDRNGGRRMVAHRGANVEIGSILDHLPQAKLFQLCNVSRDVLIKFKKLACGKAKTALDPGGNAAHLSPKDLDGIDVLVLNELECRLLTGSDYKEGAKMLSEYVNLVVVKRGERGAYAFDGIEKIFQRAFSVRAVDTTGAGDAFDAGFMAAFIKGMDVKTCLLWGVATASLKIQKRGARTGLPTIHELMDFLSKYPATTNP